jgi:hypothetical protein
MQNLPKRVRRVLTRPRRDHIPSEKDLDGAAVAIVRYVCFRMQVLESEAFGLKHFKKQAVT